MLFQKNFKLLKPNKFGYTPVYYDEKKEALERKIRAANEDKDVLKNLNDEEIRIRFRDKMRETRREKVSIANFKSKNKSKSNAGLIFLILLIGTIIIIQTR